MARTEPETAGEAQAHGHAADEPAGRREGVLLLDTDLFFVVKVVDTLKHAGYTTRVVRDEAAFAAALAEALPQVVVLNTAARGVDLGRAIGLARAAEVPVIAFGSHVDLQTQEAARQAGATRVIANAKLADLPAILERTLRRAAGDDGSRLAGAQGE